MAVTTNVPQVTWGDTGFQIPTTAQVLAGVEEDINSAFGGNLNMALDTPQGNWRHPKRRLSTTPISFS